MLTISSCDASFCQREREPSAQNKNVCIIRALLCVEVREDGRTPQHKKNRVTEEKEKYLRAQIFIRLLRIISKNDHMEPVIHGHMCSHSTHTHTHANTQTWGNCPGDGIHRRLQIRSVGFPLTFSKTCKKCPFHYWLNNVIWAPTGPNRSRQRQSSTHMLRINQITEGRVGERKSERKRGRKRDTARHLED